MARDAKWYAGWIRLLPASSADEKMRNLEAADLMEELDKKVPRWISVEERLPEELMDVLVYRDGCFAIARIITGEDWTYSGIGGDPTHWMPLPSVEGLHDN